MKLNLQRILLGLILLAAISLSAQTQLSPGGVRTNTEKCKSALLHHQLMQSDPQYAARIQAQEATIQQIISSGERTGGIYTIPVVVHILHLGEAIGSGTNISTAQINSAIANLNDCYSGTSPYPNDIEVQFQLAQRDPFCTATTGIVRVDASGTSDYATNGITSANELTIKAISNWSSSEYYNIWIVSEIDGNNGGSGTQGYAYFPGASSGRDGAVILYNSFGYDPTGSIGYNLKTYTRHNATTNHELGHAFNLYHTFEGDDADDDGTADQCPVNTACTTDGDLCCDTEAHQRDDGDCGATGTTCTGESIVTIVENIMAYSSDACQVRFSADQKTRMRAAISGTRASLLTSPGLLPVTGAEPTASKACSPQTTNLSNSFVMGVFGLTIGSTSYSSSGAVADGGFRETWCNNFSLSTSTLYSITVNNGTVNNEKVKVYIDYNNDGDFEDSGENVYSDNSGALTHTGSFTTPASPVTGQALWVRVISDFANFTISNSCYAPTYGQVEDFSVTITGGCTAPTITGTTPGSRCGTGTVVLGATASAGTLNWYAASTGGSSLGTGTSFTTPSISTTTSYFVDATNAGCTSARTSVTATVTATPSVTGTTPGSRCGTGTVVLGATASAGTLNWYAASTGGSSLGTGTSFTTPSISTTTSYFVDATNGGCTSGRTSVTATINATPSVTGTTPGSRCGTGTIVLGATASAGTLNWYAASTGGSSLGTGTSFTTPSISTTTSYFVDATNGGCTSARTAVAAIINASPGLSSVMTQSTCPDNDGSINLTVTGGAPTFTYNWSNGSTTEDISGLAQGSYTVIVTDANGCSAQHIKAVTQNCGSSVPNTQVAASQCGQTVADLSGYFYCVAVTGAQDYEWEFTNSGLGYSFAKIRGVSYATIPKTWISGLQYGTTYNVRVRANVGGIWGNYSTTCTITIGTSIPNIQVAASQCGQTVSDLSGYFQCEAVTGAQDYEWEFTNSGLGYSYTKIRGVGYATIPKTWISGLQYGVPYNVRVRVKVGGVWGNYSTTCTITIGTSIPNTQVAASQCGQTISDLSGYFHCEAITGAQDYEWEFTNSGLGYSFTKARGFGYATIPKNWIGGLQNGITYDVRVRVKFGGVWGSYGTVCAITINTSMMGMYTGEERGMEDGKSFVPEFSVTAFPNPSGDNGFEVAIEGLEETGSDVLLTVVDIYGKTVYTEMFKTQSNGTLVKINSDGHLAKGIYFINALVNGKSINQKAIVR
jgi:hypothetical protein